MTVNALHPGVARTELGRHTGMHRSTFSSVTLGESPPGLGLFAEPSGPAPSAWGPGPSLGGCVAWLLAEPCLCGVQPEPLLCWPGLPAQNSPGNSQSPLAHGRAEACRGAVEPRSNGLCQARPAALPG